MKKALSIVLVVLILLCSIPMCYAETAEKMPEIAEYGFVDCNNVRIEYGIYGDLNAEPLLLLPPNGGDMHCFDDSILPEMSKHFKIITVSPRGTGKSDRGEGSLTFEAMSDDLVYVLDYLNIEQTNIFGFSDGGNLGLVFTTENQHRVKSLVIMGSNINPLGTGTFDQISICFRYLGFAIKAFFTQDENDKLRRDIQGLMVFHPNLTFSDLKKIDVPVLNIYGEHDMIKRIHSKLITRTIPNAQELMIVDGGHSTCFEQTDTVINPALLAFYNGLNLI